MAFLVNCFIRKNTSEIREHLERGGLSICQCCTFDEESFKNDDYLSGGESVWLQTYTRNGTVHGVGYWDESVPPRSIEEACEFFLDTTNSYDCKMPCAIKTFDEYNFNSSLFSSNAFFCAKNF